jgi:hypothetical protein
MDEIYLKFLRCFNWSRLFIALNLLNVLRHIFLRSISVPYADPITLRSKTSLVLTSPAVVLRQYSVLHNRATDMSPLTTRIRFREMRR